ncbi:O-methyltransferase [Heyndrickxia acidicola]|uniref:tRNA 5-hydroxyuridine methyltransferase n=1 Tax=Heyndrickxia acidicola TaxID=209389 RepID=A0ABU6MJ85_9BACI|nr:O-methyltransferase [Heyndrickxia acidicola]MED1204728.1 O-methyltransferase [Heyndrickxia acidicola]
MNEKVISYIHSLIKARNPLLNEMEEYAREHNVPIMDLAGIEALLQLLRIQKSKRILEIGTAIGYSALRMAEALPDSSIVSIERDDERYQQALHFIERSNCASQIKVIKGDALDIAETIEKYGPFDSLFIDAAKGQYLKFFELYTPMLGVSGFVYTDNVLFKGLVAEEQIESKRIRNLVSKIKHYNEWLMSHEAYVTAILPVGDGLAISQKI